MDSNLLLRKKELINTTATHGWRFVKELGETVVRAKERKAIDEEDDTKGASLRREAKVARQFLNEFFQLIEQMKQVEGESSDEKDWYEVATE